MKHIETLNGSGTVQLDDGSTSAAEYTLCVRQKEIYVGHGIPPVPGVRSIDGQVDCDNKFIFKAMNSRDNATLIFEDGRQLSILFKDMSGTILGSGGIR